MQRNFHLIYNGSTATRILKLAIRAAQVKVEQWAYMVWVHIPGQLSKFMSKAQFRAEFVNFRRAGAKGLLVTPQPLTPGSYGVRNEAKGSLYTVTTSPTAIACTCEDYHQQIQALGKGMCKHGYAVLNHLGYSTLADYVAAQDNPDRWPPAPQKQPTRFKGRSID